MYNALAKNYRYFDTFLKEEVLTSVKKALSHDCANLNVEFLRDLVFSQQSRLVLKNITPACIRQMKGFLPDGTFESEDLSQAVPYLSDFIFAEELKGVNRATLEATTPRQALHMNSANCSKIHLEGLREDTQMVLRNDCFIRALKANPRSISYLSPDVVVKFLQQRSVSESIPVNILVYPIWQVLKPEWIIRFAGF